MGKKRKREEEEDNDDSDNNDERDEASRTTTLTLVQHSRLLLHDDTFGPLSDIKVVTKQKTYHLHRVYLIRVPYFAPQIMGPFESPERCIDLTLVQQEVQGADKEENWNIIFEYVYTDCLSDSYEIESLDVVEVVQLAKFLGLEGLVNTVLNAVRESSSMIYTLKTLFLLGHPISDSSILDLVVYLNDKDSVRSLHEELENFPLELYRIFIRSDIVPLQTKLHFAYLMIKANIGDPLIHNDIEQHEYNMYLDVFNDVEIWPNLLNSKQIIEKYGFIPQGFEKYHSHNKSSDEAPVFPIADYIEGVAGASDYFNEIVNLLANKISLRIKGHEDDGMSWWNIEVNNLFTGPTDCQIYLNYHQEEKSGWRKADVKDLKPSNWRNIDIDFGETDGSNESALYHMVVIVRSHAQSTK